MAGQPDQTGTPGTAETPAAAETTPAAETTAAAAATSGPTGISKATEMSEPTGAPGYFAPVSMAMYVQLTTFRRDGRAVPTPVHVVTDGDAAYFRTWNTAGKAKRLRHTAAVEVAPATFRGRPLVPPIPAQAHLLDGEAAQRAARLLAARHPILHGRLIPWYHRRRGWTTQQYRLDPPTSQA